MDQDEIDRLVDELTSGIRINSFLDDMEVEQKEFYQGLKKHIENGVYPDIEGQIDNILVYMCGSSQRRVTQKAMRNYIIT